MSASPQARSLSVSFGGGASIGALGGLIGLGGAEFRLPLLIGVCVLGRNRGCVVVMAAGSIVRSYLGGRLLGLVPSAVILPALAAILLISASKAGTHNAMTGSGGFLSVRFRVGMCWTQTFRSRRGAG